MSRHPVVTLGRHGGLIVTGENYASTAESLMDKYMDGYKGRRFGETLTTSKLRSIYSLVMNAYVKVDSPEEYEEHKPDIQYLKVRMAYEAGREASVKSFLTATHLMELVESIEGYEQFKLYCRYAEALVAYFKFFGGRDS